MRRRIIRKNKKRRDPRYFLHEDLEEVERVEYLDITGKQVQSGVPGERGAPMPDDPRAFVPGKESDETEGGAPSNIEWLERQDWLQAKGIRADSTTDEDHEALRGALAGKNIVDPLDVNQIMKATQDGSENDVIPLGKVGEEVWFKTGDNKYGKIALVQSEPEGGLGFGR